MHSSWRKLCLQGRVPKHWPLRDLLESCVTQRRQPSQSVNIFYVPWSSAEEVASAKRWVKEQRRIAFNYSSFYLSYKFSFFLCISFPSGFDGVANCTVPEIEIQEYVRNLERLDMVLENIEEYIYIAFAALRKEDLVQRMFAMVS